MSRTSYIVRLRATTLMCVVVCLAANGIAATEVPGKSTDEGVKDKMATGFRQVDDYPVLIQSGELKLEDIDNPHWRADACLACHTETGEHADAGNLRYKDEAKICYNCHSPEFDHRYIHPQNVLPDKKMQARMGPAMRTVLEESHNKMTCSTCHDISLQCRSDRKQQSTNPKFLRSGPHESRSQLCFACHDDSRYQRLNPHDQIDDRGILFPEKCRVCHADPVAVLYESGAVEHLKFYSSRSLTELCIGCHPWTPHPGGQFSFFRKESGPDHLVRPTDEISQRMEAMMESNGISFPLEPQSGKIYCGTCHNVHEKGVIGNPMRAKGADSKTKLRDKKICRYCHLI